MGETQDFTPEQMMAMLLTKLRDTAEKGLKTKVVDVVVSVSIQLSLRKLAVGFNDTLHLGFLYVFDIEIIYQPDKKS